MYCPSCGAPNGAGSKFCFKCGKAMPTNTPPAAAVQPMSSAAPAATSISAWRPVGIIVLVAASASVLAFFMSWLTTPAVNLGGPSVVGQVTGWALFRIPLDLVTSLSNTRGSDLAGGLLGQLPGQMQLFLIVYLIDSVMLILTPLVGIAIAVNSWQLLQVSDDWTAAQRQRRNQRLALIGLIPPIVLLILIVLLVAALSNPYGRSSDLGLVLRLFDFGFWFTIVALVVITLAGPLAAPKQR